MHKLTHPFVSAVFLSLKHPNRWGAVGRFGKKTRHGHCPETPPFIPTNPWQTPKSEYKKVLRPGTQRRGTSGLGKHNNSNSRCSRG